MHSITLSSISLTLALLSASTNAESTVTGVSQIWDGQIQAPTSTVAAWASSSLGADPEITTSTTWAPYENPFTIYTTQTNSLGVITGHPAVVTSQPEVVTSQPPSATLPSLSGYYYGNGTTTASSTETTEAQPTTLATSTVTGSGSSGASGSRSATATFAQATGAGMSSKVVGAGMGLVALAMGFSML